MPLAELKRLVQVVLVLMLVVVEVDTGHRDVLSLLLLKLQNVPILTFRRR